MNMTTAATKTASQLTAGTCIEEPPSVGGNAVKIYRRRLSPAPFPQSAYELLLPEFGPRLSRSLRKRFGVRRRKALHQRLMADLRVTKYFFSVRAENLQTAIRVLRVSHVAQVIRDSMVEEWLQRAEDHPRAHPVAHSLNRVGCLVRVHSCEPTVRHLGDDSGVHEKQRTRPVAAYDRKTCVLSALPVDDERDRVRHVNVDMHRSGLLRAQRCRYCEDERDGGKTA